MLGKFQELIIVEEHHRVHCVAFQLEHMLEILLKKKSFWKGNFEVMGL